MSSRESVRLRLITVTACTAFLGLLLDIAWSNLLLGVFLLSSLSAFRPGAAWTTLRNHPLAGLLLVFFLLHLIGVAYSANSENAWFVVEKKLSFLLVPICVIPAVTSLSPEERRKLIRLIAWLIVGSGGWYVLVAMLKWQLYHFTLAFHQDYFPPIPYVYYALYFVVFSLLLLDVYSATSQKNRIIWCGVLTLYSLAILMLLGSKSGIVAFSAGVGVIVWKRIPLNKWRWLTAAGVLTVVVLMLAAYPRTLHRFVEMKNNLRLVTEDKLSQTEEFTGLNLRLFFWKTALVEVARSGDWPFGVGTGDAQDFLDDAFARHNLDKYGYSHFDSHNQWIMTLLEIGLPGVLVLGWIFVVCVKRSDDVPGLVCFALVSFVFMLSESILEANKGIVFFVLMASLLGSQVRKDAKEPAA